MYYPEARHTNRLLIVMVMMLLPLGLTFINASNPPTQTVRGVVTDAGSHNAMPYVSVIGGRGSRSTTTDSLGRFTLRLPSNATLKIKSEGYATQTIKGPFPTDTLRISLEHDVTELQEVVVKFKKQKYKKRNPASELMLKVRAYHDSVDPGKIDGYNFDSYSKTVIGLNSSEKNSGTWVIPVKDRQNLSKLIDTARWTADKIMNIAIKEKTSTVVYKNDEPTEIITGRNSDGLDQKFSTEYTNVFLEDVLREIDLYKNDLHMLRSDFVSPLSSNGINFYHYELVDTVPIGNQMCVELSFAPANPEMTGLNGKLYIPVNDSVKYVRRAMMRMPKATNINYVKSLILNQNFKLDSIGKLHKTVDDLMVNVQIAPGTPVFSFNRQIRRDNFNYKGRPEYQKYVDAVGSSFVEDLDLKRPDSYWKANRLVPLTAAESNLIGTNSVFRRDKGFRVTETIIDLLVKGYIPTGDDEHNKVFIGPINSFVSYTNAGGWRFQLGGMTTSKLWPHVFLRGFGAYSLGDHKWKGAMEVEYSFEKRRLHALEFPMNNISIGWNFDMDQLGQEQSWNSTADLLGSLKTINTNLITYRHHVYIDYNKEWRNNLSMHVGFRYVRQQHSPWVEFRNGFGQVFGHFGQAVFNAGIRWAPGERFIQTLNQRNLINRDALIITLDQEYGPKKLLGSRFTISKTELGIEKTLRFSAYGYLEAAIRAAKIWTQVPFTELYWQVANTSYLTNPRSFSMMNPMEFAMDEFVSWYLQYNMQGLLFNKIPYVKRARIREVFSFRGFWGNLTKRNNPARAQNVLKFPGIETSTIGTTPYMECSVGLENIFTFLRVEYVWRLTYRNKPDVRKGGLRIGLHFNF